MDGQLDASEPIAQSCYPGRAADAEKCAAVSSSWSDVSFQIDSPIGYPQPFSLPCPPVNASAGEEPAGSCTLGNAPVLTINATTADHVAVGVRFAHKHNIRLVLRDTGHDFLGRSTGHGSLQIWIRHLRTGIKFHDTFTRPGSSWKGSAVTIGGGYEWDDVYGEAAERGLVVVGGVSPTVGCIGGWMQGGGHGPASHEYGLGSDQVLEAKIVLADGSLVTMSPTEHPDLFFAVRGGGPSSYGVVVETTVKAWPTTPVVAQSLNIVIASKQTQKSLQHFMAAVKDVYASITDAASHKWGGYGSWLTDPSLTLYTHTWTNFHLDLDEARTSLEPLAAKLNSYSNSSLSVIIDYTEHATFADFYNTYYGGQEGATGELMKMASRFFDEASLGQDNALAAMLNATAGTPAHSTVNTLEVHGAQYGAIGKDGSAANPAWRRAIANQNVYLGYQASTPPEEVEGLIREVTDVREAALKAFAPNTGAYGNVANIHNPKWKHDFFGDVYDQLLEIKARYDPYSIFYCRTCVGSDTWQEKESGRLCKL